MGSRKGREGNEERDGGGGSIEKQRHEGEIGVRNRGQRVKTSGTRAASTARYQRES